MIILPELFISLYCLSCIIFLYYAVDVVIYYFSVKKIFPCHIYYYRFSVFHHCHLYWFWGLIYFMCVCMSLNVCMCTMYVCGPSLSREEHFGSLGTGVTEGRTLGTEPGSPARAATIGSSFQPHTVLSGPQTVLYWAVRACRAGSRYLGTLLLPTTGHCPGTPCIYPDENQPCIQRSLGL